MKTTQQEYTQQKCIDIGQSDVSLNETSAKTLSNDEATTVQGPMNNNKKMESQKVCTMGMLMNNSDISTTTLIEQEQAEESHKKFLYARAIHSNHTRQHHMQQIMEHQRGVDKYRNMMNEGRDLIP